VIGNRSLRGLGQSVGEANVDWAGGLRTRPCCRLLDLRAIRSVISNLFLDTIIHRVLPSQFATDRPQPPPPYPTLGRPPTEGTVSARTRRVFHPSLRLLSTHSPSLCPCHLTDRLQAIIPPSRPYHSRPRLPVAFVTPHLVA
jgi:hypothetical protein